MRGHRFAVIRPNGQVAGALGIRAESFVHHICRVRIVDGIPKNTEYASCPSTRSPGSWRATLRASIYHCIERDLRPTVDSAHRIVRPVVPTPDEREWLHIQDGQPLIEVRQVAYLDDGTPFELSTTCHTRDHDFRAISTRS